MPRRTCRRTLHIVYCLLGLFAVAACASPALARNCPRADDILVVVSPVEPTPVTLPVTNDENGVVSVFQFPLGGQLVHTGPGQLDYVFIPDASFDGRSSVRFRVVPNNDCGGGNIIGTVTLTGATLNGPAGGGLPDHEHACGIGVAGVAGMAQAGVLLVWFAQRWRRKTHPLG